MAQQHKQAFCHQCGELTLHIGEVYKFPHAIHLLLTLLTCTIWVWIWTLHAVVNSFDRPTFLCSRCGQAEAKKPPTAAEIEWAAERRQARLAKRRRWQAELAIRIAWCFAWIRRLPETLDTLLRRVAGEGNELIYRFLQCLAVIAALAILVLGIWLNLRPG